MVCILDTKKLLNMNTKNVNDNIHNNYTYIDWINDM